MIKVSIMGVAGRMGRSIFHLLNAENDIQIVGATEIGNHPEMGNDIGLVSGEAEIGVTLTSRIEDASSDADVIVDFTAPSSTLNNARYASSNGKAMVIGTTGFSEEEKNELSKLAENFPCVFSPNMSIGVNVMFEATKKLAEILGDDFDIEIIEAHHKHKVDAPSGTALRLGEAAAQGLARDFNSVARFERHGAIGERKEKEIGMQTIRAGDIVGEHTVMFCGAGERIELTHRAMSRDNFAKGVVRAVKWVPGKQAGMYTMKEVLGI
ncbi:MAG: 4-hydroxy-tetrahydrodipicolinate reductase [Thermodesulfobacteriales bacterium]|jgi:4-hydroxy-tetrahydrodipicolinate reductase|nr:MAG: 4-hydroxy-tetrahydrodipicolinate reductase [Thermodesulfobacteriales bacterium]